MTFTPKPVSVFCTITDRRCNDGKPWTIRVGVCHTLGEAKQIIAHDKEVMARNFTAGDILLIEGSNGETREYSVFAAEWTKLEA